MIMFTCTKPTSKQHLRSIHEKVKQHWDWVEKKRCLQEKAFIRKIRYVCENLLNSYFKDSICFGIFKLYKNEESFGNQFSFLLLQNVLTETTMFVLKNIYISYLAFCHFLISWSLEDSKHIKRYIFHFFLWRQLTEEEYVF